MEAGGHGQPGSCRGGSRIQRMGGGQHGVRPLHCPDRRPEPACSRARATRDHGVAGRGRASRASRVPARLEVGVVGPGRDGGAFSPDPVLPGAELGRRPQGHRLGPGFGHEPVPRRGDANVGRPCGGREPAWRAELARGVDGNQAEPDKRPGRDAATLPGHLRARASHRAGRRGAALESPGNGH